MTVVDSMDPLAPSPCRKPKPCDRKRLSSLLDLAYTRKYDACSGGYSRQPEFRGPRGLT